MNVRMKVFGAAAGFGLLACATVQAQDWPQWRGTGRDGVATGFEEPLDWPESLEQVWKVTVGDGVASPSLVGDRLYAFGLEGEHEVLRCLDAATGEELWQDSYPTQGADGAASGFAGPRSSPAVAEGKVATIGVRGALSVFDAGSGKLLWRNEEFEKVPRFYTSSSPLIVGGLCIAQLGGEDNGVTVAFDLESGEERWRWSGEGTTYASPFLFAGDDGDVLVVTTTRSISGLSVDEGELLWTTPFVVRGFGYNAATPLVDGDTVFFSGTGRGTRAATIVEEEGEHRVEEAWANEDLSVMYNSPVLKDGFVYGLSDGSVLFCLDAGSGEATWTLPLLPQEEQPGAGGQGGLMDGFRRGREGGGGQERGGERGGRRSGRRGGGGGMMGGGRGYGSIVDAGPVLFVLTPSSELIVFEPDEIEFIEHARYKVSESSTFAYPIVSGSRIFVKDQDSVALWRFPES